MNLFNDSFFFRSSSCFLIFLGFTWKCFTIILWKFCCCCYFFLTRVNFSVLYYFFLLPSFAHWKICCFLLFFSKRAKETSEVTYFMFYVLFRLLFFVLLNIQSIIIFGFGFWENYQMECLEDVSIFYRIVFLLL